MDYRAGGPTPERLEALRRSLTGSVRVLLLWLGPPEAPCAGPAPRAEPGSAVPLPAGLDLGWLRGPALVSVAAAESPVSGLAALVALAADVLVLDPAAWLGLGALPLAGSAALLLRGLGWSRSVLHLATASPLAATELAASGLAVLGGTPGVAATVDRLVADLLRADRDTLAEAKALLHRAEGEREPSAARLAAARLAAARLAGGTPEDPASPPHPAGWERP